jgi:hypothetical protein
MLALSTGRKPGLPDGIFSYQKYQFGYILVGLLMENVGIFDVELVYFVTLWYVLWHFGIFLCNLVFFPHFGMFYQEKSGKPAANDMKNIYEN